MKVYELSQRFYFEASHTLDRSLDAPADVQGSRRIHGHTYQAEITVCGPRDSRTGMVVDLGVLRDEISKLRGILDHAFLDDVPALAAPTLEGLCDFIADRLCALQPPAVSVRVWRDASGDSCLLRLDALPG